jgi:DNA-binding NarL/FixJ family response regulator
MVLAKEQKLKNRKGVDPLRFDFNEKTAQRFLNECGFTDDEKEIFLMLRRGWYYTKIAQHVFVSEMTVKRRVKSIKQKILDSM